MESKRQAKVARLIQRDLSEIFLHEGRSLFGHSFIGVSQVRVSPDLGYVKVYLSFINEKNPQQLLELVKAHGKEIRTKLAQKIRNQMRKIPELEFFYDDTMDYVEKMDKLFDEIKKADGKGENREE